MQSPANGTHRTYWTTREAAAECGLTDTTLRWYERIGLLDRVERGSDLRRRFTPRDLEWLRLLTRLRATGMPVREMQRYAELVRRRDGEAERLAILEAHRDRITAALAVQTECLALVTTKIETYRRALADGGGSGEPADGVPGHALPDGAPGEHDASKESACAPSRSAV